MAYAESGLSYLPSLASQLTPDVSRGSSTSTALNRSNIPNARLVPSNDALPSTRIKPIDCLRSNRVVQRTIHDYLQIVDHIVDYI